MTWASLRGKAMSKRDQAWWMGFLLIGMSATFVIGYIIRGRFPIVIDNNELQIATAVGTVGAVVVALYFGLRSDAQRRSEQRGRSQLAAALIATDLDRFEAEAKQLKEQVLPLYLMGGTPRNVPPQAAVDNKLMVLTPESLRLFYDVHPTVGVSVAKAISDLRSFEEWRQGTHQVRDEKKSVQQRPLDVARAQWAARRALDAHAELRSAFRTVSRVLAEVDTPEWHIVDPDEN